MNLNNEQTRAVAHISGAMLVLAGPGSGKTSVLISRVHRLIFQHHIPEQNILVVTFTKTAAGEMAQRYLHLSGQTHTEVTFGTIHSIFYQILNSHYGKHKFHILTGPEKRKFLKQAFHLSGGGTEPDARAFEMIEAEISQLKSRSVRWEDFSSAALDKERFRLLLAQYQKMMQVQQYLDFDDILLQAYRLFTEIPSVLTRWQERYTYLLVDEFQDVDALQYILLRKLAGAGSNLFMVGDDDQSIYGFRGASPGIMLHLQRDFPQLQTVRLEANYRSCPAVVEASKRLIAHNRERLPKSSFAALPREGRVLTHAVHDRRAEIRFLAEEIDKERKCGVRPEQIAVLTRTNLGLQMVLPCLLFEKIEVQSRSGLPDLEQSFIWQDILTYLRLSYGPASRKLYLQILNRPQRYLPRSVLPADISRVFDDLEHNIYGTALGALSRDLAFMKKMPPYAAIHYLRYAVGYGEFLSELARSRNLQPEVYLDLYAAIETLSSGTGNLNELLEKMRSYSRKRGESMSGAKTGGEIRAMTMHSAKGLEFEIVHILDVNEGNIPEIQKTNNIEEERRIFYVGMTRAVSELHLYYINSREGLLFRPSRFLTELSGGPALPGESPDNTP